MTTNPFDSKESNAIVCDECKKMMNNPSEEERNYELCSNCIEVYSWVEFILDNHKDYTVAPIELQEQIKHLVHLSKL